MCSDADIKDAIVRCVRAHRVCPLALADGLLGARVQLAYRFVGHKGLSGTLGVPLPANLCRGIGAYQSAWELMDV